MLLSDITKGIHHSVTLIFENITLKNIDSLCVLSFWKIYPTTSLCWYFSLQSLKWSPPWSLTSRQRRNLIGPFCTRLLSYSMFPGEINPTDVWNIPLGLTGIHTEVSLDPQVHLWPFHSDYSMLVHISCFCHVALFFVSQANQSVEGDWSHPLFLVSVRKLPSSPHPLFASLSTGAATVAAYWMWQQMQWTLCCSLSLQSLDVDWHAFFLLVTQPSIELCRAAVEH